MSAGVNEAQELAAYAEGRQRCLLGLHPWMPWVETEPGIWRTWCGRKGCNEAFRYEAKP